MQFVIPSVFGVSSSLCLNASVCLYFIVFVCCVASPFLYAYEHSLHCGLYCVSASSQNLLLLHPYTVALAHRTFLHPYTKALPVPATIGNLPSSYRRVLGVRSIPRIRQPRAITVVTLHKGKRKTISLHNILNITAMLKWSRGGGACGRTRACNG